MALVAGLAVVVYLASVRGGFVYDDDATIVHNAFLRDWRNLARLLRPSALAGVPDRDRPLMIVSTMLDHWLWGARAAGYHAHSLAWHALASVLALLVARRVLPTPAYDARAPLVAAALFALHPVHVEAVAAVSDREDLLCAALVLTSYLGLGRARDGGGRGAWAVAVAAAVLAAFAKQTALAMPGAVAATDAVAARPRWRAWPATATALALAAALALTWLPYACALAGGLPSVAATSTPLLVRLERAPWLLATGLLRLVWPFGLSPVYPPAATSALAIAVALAALAALAVVVRRARAPELGWGVAWAVAFLLPVLDVVPIFDARADRHLYLPSLGLCIAAAPALLRLGGRLAAIGRRRGDLAPAPAVTLAPALALGTLLAVATLRQSLIWLGPLRLWRAATAHAPDSPRAWTGLSFAALQHGDLDEAGHAAARAAALAGGGYTRAALAQALVRLERGDQAGGIAALTAAAEAASGPERALLVHNLGVAWERAGDRAHAAAAYRQALALAPELAPARDRLAALAAADATAANASTTKAGADAP